MNTETTLDNNIVNSSSKYFQTKEILKDMARQALGRDITDFHEKKLGGGMSNAVYQIEADGTRMVLKIASDPATLLMRHEKDCILNEANMLRIFEEHLDIPAPKLIYLDITCQICKVPYFFMSLIEGEPLLTMDPKPSEDNIMEIKKQVGIICKKISSLQTKYFGIPTLPDTHVEHNYDFITLIFKMLLQDATDKQIMIPDISNEELLFLLEKYKDALNEATNPCYIHTDTWDGNLMIKEGRLEGLIDYAAVLYGDPLMNHDFHDFGEINRNFLEGYGKTEFTKNELIRISIYKIWQRLGMIVERGYRNYDDPNQYSWVHGEFTKEVNHLKTFEV